MSIVFGEEFVADLMIWEYFAVEYFKIRKEYVPVKRSHEFIERTNPNVSMEYNESSQSAIYIGEFGAVKWWYRLFAKFKLLVSYDNVIRFRWKDESVISYPSPMDDLKRLLVNIFDEFVEKDSDNTKLPFKTELDISGFLASFDR